MPWILQMLGFALLLIGIAIALWVSVWVLLFFLALGLVGVVWSHIRHFLTAKGILNPTFGMPPHEAADDASITIVDTTFTRVESHSIPDQKQDS